MMMSQCHVVYPVLKDLVINFDRYVLIYVICVIYVNCNDC